MKVVFLSGTYIQAPEGKPEVRLGPGSYMMQPGGNYRHITSCDKASECLFFVESSGKFDLKVVEAAKRTGEEVTSRAIDRITIFIITLLLAAADSRADTYPRQPGIDILHYVFRLTIEDTSDRIVGETTVTFRIVQPVRELLLDLTSAADGKGMTVSAA